ncbi:AAA family ATPase [Candidatus Thiodictyon syntrophicum]|uniref:AAA family ATPase n=1 Tax=Candidatus Thiodictyon syntrophicum TaxID=1166950 RepID=UPI0012FD09A9|nr:AAA family ATPase [Candidatus Thiodictyon syntrophicum]
MLEPPADAPGTQGGQGHGAALAARPVRPNEWRILERLQGLPGCPRLLPGDPGAPVPRVADFGGVPLGRSGLMGNPDLGRFLTLALALARAVARCHGRGVIHHDLNPAKILIRADDLRVQIIGFDLAATFAEDRSGFDPLDRLPGALAYLSPEQTGRMNRPVDYRTDLYSLGAVLYALATGAPPFAQTDTLGLIHAHLARSPAPPRDRAAWLPPRLSELILALLAKEPEERYQSAAGLADDLARLRRALRERADLDAVPLRARDLPLAPRPPRRLHGRDAELATLTAAFARVVAGATLGLFVAGYAGVGKTALIRELHRPATLANGLFISGKCEQFQRDRPLLAPSQCLRHLCQLLLAGSETAVAAWRERILAGLGPDAGALLEVLPELEALLGPQPPAPRIGPLEAQGRLRALLVALVRQVAAPTRPLVLFLDDLQWADAPSLDFLGALLEDAALAGLLLIGAYRDNEVDGSHPLRHRLRQPTAAGTPPVVLTLAGLTAPDLDALLADMLHIAPAQARSPATALFAKTNGNPFFTIALVNELHRGGALRPDPRRGRWHWDAATLLARPVSDNVVDLLAAGLSDLPSATAESLVAAACLGTDCTLGRLALATGTDPETLSGRLLPALERGILITPSALAVQRGDPAAALRFCHDRMQQAVQQRRDDAWRSRLHLAMARRFAQADKDPPRRLDAALHYAAAAPLIVEPVERARARDLLLAAAVGARQAGDYATGERLLRLGVDLLAADAWQREHGAAFGLHAELHLVLFSQARQSEADAIYAQLAANTSSPLLLVDPTATQIANLLNRALYDEAIALGCELLARLGMPVPRADLEQTLRHYRDLPADIFRAGTADPGTPAATGSALTRELESFYRQVAAGALEHLLQGRDLTDQRLAGAAKLLNHMIPAAHCSSSHPVLTTWLALRVARLWIENGYCAENIYGLVCACVAIIILRGDFTTAERLAGIALQVGATREGSRETARGLFVYTNHIGHWCNPLEEDVAYAHQAFAELLRAGDLEIASFTFYASQAALLDTGAQLAELEAETAAALRFTRKTGSTTAEKSYLPYRQLVRTLRGETTAPGSFNDAGFDEQAHQTALRGDPIPLAYFHIHRALAACLFNDHGALAHHVETALELGLAIHPDYATALINLLHSLTLARRVRETSAAARAPLLERLAINQAWLAARAAAAPMNFGHLHALVEAERLDALGHSALAFETFEQAMRQAQAHRRPWHQALITERAGHCYLRHGLEHAARALLAQAQALYRAWGATCKARAMLDELPFLGPSRAVGAGERRHDALNQEALLRASQALASERSLPQLVARVTALLGQLTGATDVQLLLRDETGAWYLEGGLRGAERLERITLQTAKERQVLPAGVLRLGLSTQAPVICDDAVIDSRFKADPHFAALPVCSLLGLPVLLHGRIGAFLILENRLYRAAFPVGQVETLSLLCGQLAISIDSARLYQSLEERVAEREQALKQAYERLTAAEVERSRTAERERLLQDMHDGFGSQLAGARLRIEHGELTQGQVAILLQECLDDLYLVVDTMSNEAGSLRNAIVDWRYRCERRLAEQPIRVDWQIELDACPPLAQRLILQLLRIMQEALSNGLKHARAGHIALQAIYRADGQLHIAVTDDGIGIPEAVAQGRGLGNMQSRARELGGELTVSRLARGTRVSLTLAEERFADPRTGNCSHKDTKNTK